MSSTGSAAHAFQRGLASFRQGQLDLAVQWCRQAVALDPGCFDAQHLLGLIALGRGDVAGGIEWFRQSLRSDPRQPVVHLNLGTALLRLQPPDAPGALACFEVALALRPGYVDALHNRGTALVQLQRAGEALQAFGQVLALRPGDPAATAGFIEALAQEAGQHLQAGRADAALHAYTQSLRLRPDHPALLVALGNCLVQLERPAEAVAAYDRALQVSPGSGEACFNRGHALLALGRLQEALASYDVAIERLPALGRAFVYRGHVFRKLGRPADALASYERACALEGSDVEGWCGAAATLVELRRLPEAQAGFERTLALDPANPDALSGSGSVLFELDEPERALACFAKLRMVAPDRLLSTRYALGMYLHCQLQCCDWRDYNWTFTAIEAGLARGELVTAPSLATASIDSPALLHDCARLFVDHELRDVVAGEWVRNPQGHDRIRVAYVSADFREHPVSRLIVGLLEAHDKARFECIGISLRAPEASGLGQRIRATFDQFHDVSGMSDDEAVALMRSLDIDIAIDLGGYTSGCRPGLFARRGAPVQASFLGFPGTSGARYIDYLLADRIVVPEAHRPWFSERVVYLGNCFQPNDSLHAREAGATPPPDRRELGLPEVGFVFCCFNAQYKIVPSVFESWMRLLLQVPRSVLWLGGSLSGVGDRNLRAAAIQRGVAAERLVFAGRVKGHEAHLARYRVADLFLDTLPFNAHATASDVLRSGLPLLTCRGDSYASRVAASLLDALDLPELVCADLGAYERKALQLAAEPAVLAGLRERLADNLEGSALFDPVVQARHLEQAYVRMHEAFLHGEDPAPFGVA
jgi:predicted O-linked N-acetylglucosamine transferase (SPINDLY family)